MSTDSVHQPNVRAFPAYPCVERYFPGQSIEESRQRLATVIERGGGPGLVIGASGTGKSLLMQALAQQFADQFDVAQLSCSQLCTRRALVQTILFELGLPYRFHEEGELRLSLLDHLVPNERCPNGILLLVDEAQTLPVHLLEEIRLLTNLVRDGRPRVRLVLAGSLALEEQFATPELETFQQRIAARCYLAPLGANEIGPYVQAHLEAAGASFANIRFEEEAYHAIYSATDGVPRLVNQISDRTLQQMLASSKTSADAKAIQTAWADLQHLPTPWETAPESLNGTGGAEEVGAGDEVGTENSSIVEFGELSADAVDTTKACFPALDEELSADTCDAEPLPEVVPDIPESLPVVELVPAVELASSTEPCGVACSGCLGETGVNDTIAEVPGDAVLGDAVSGDAAPATQMVEFQVAMQPATNPFEENFAEEEIVLENFASLGEAMHRGTPRVECQLDGQMSQLVHDVASLTKQNAAVETPVELELELELESPAPSSNEMIEPELRDLSIDHVDTLQTVPLVALAPEKDSHHLETYDPVMPEEDYSPADRCNEPDLATITYPGAGLAICGTDSEIELLDANRIGDSSESRCVDAPIVDAPSADEPLEPTDLDEEDDILIVEDAPVEFTATEGSGSVRRQDYRQLFAKLSRG